MYLNLFLCYLILNKNRAASLNYDSEENDLYGIDDTDEQMLLIIKSDEQEGVLESIIKTSNRDKRFKFMSRNESIQLG